ncbi:MAG: uroporphyrinogen-III synthase, partial [Syntrophomonadaceae bacterium]|nr:uroporphyrinogen-III synthase [Syntrophomonadaceae bacterium]
IVVTRARAQASIMVDKITELGGEAIEFPSIIIRPVENLNLLYRALKDIRHYNWLIFTSVNAVDIFFTALKAQDMDIRDLYGIKIAAIGAVTRDKIIDRGLKVDVVPDEFVAEGMIKALSGRIKPGDWILLPRAHGARNILPEAIKSEGAHVNEVIIYEAVPNGEAGSNILESIKRGQVDFITFTSSSTVSNFVNIIGWQNVETINRRCKIACIGPITANTAGEHGLKVDIIAKQYTIDGLIEAILESG